VNRSSVVIVSPALAAANNGNWQTARRWCAMLSTRHAVRIASQWPDERARAQPGADRVLLALHARRSADSIQAWAHERGSQGLGVVLTGTDLYHDIAVDPQAQASLEAASALVVLQALGIEQLPPAARGKARVIHQSSTAWQPLAKGLRQLRAVMVGHLRDVKSPQTLFEAALLLADRRDIRIDHIGDAAQPGWAERARATQAAPPGYRWLGPLPHGQARRAIQRAHVLVHTSAMEGGAHVIMEALRSGTPVLASRVDGNVGMLGADYAGYFPHGDAAALAQLLARCRDDQRDPPQDPPGSLLAQLWRQCELRAPLFAPEAEQAALLRLTAELQDTA
jgi:putative glycosyltransferase (TIGR04348 family)